MPASQQRFVVGIDGSSESKEALRWALGVARLTGAAVDVVAAWRSPVSDNLSVLGGDLGGVEGDARKMLAKVLSQVGDDASGVEVRELVGEGAPAKVLLESAKHADLLVIGSRGRGGFASAVLGSVSLACVLHSSCPVLVFRDGADEDSARRPSGGGAGG
jgi:nucleotide-binding universal stress UspA family protein